MDQKLIKDNGTFENNCPCHRCTSDYQVTKKRIELPFHCAQHCKTFYRRNSNKSRFSFKFQNALKCLHGWFLWYVPALMSIFDALTFYETSYHPFNFDSVSVQTQLVWSQFNALFGDGMKSDWQFTYMEAL